MMGDAGSSQRTRADEMILAALADGPLSVSEITEKMFFDCWETWAQQHGLYGIEWGNKQSEPFGARLLAYHDAKERGEQPLHSWQLRSRLLRMERAGLVCRVQVEGHRPMLWRVA